MIRSLLRRVLGRAGGPETAPASLVVDAAPDRPIPFGYKEGWLAVRSDVAEAVASSLGLQGVVRSNWASRFDQGNRRLGAVFLTPPVDGWTLVATGSDLEADAEANAAQVVEVLERLSAQFGEAQFFGSYRSVSYAAWFRATDGVLHRAYSVADGEHAINHGPMTEAERDLGFPDITGIACAELWDTLEPAIEDDADFYPGSEENPHAIAREWSVSPMDLRELLDDQVSTGWIGMPENEARFRA